MIISFYPNKVLIYISIYCVFKVLFYISASNFFSSFLPSLYLISFSKIFSFILYKFQMKISKKIQSIENDENINSIQENNINEEQLINQPEQININRSAMYIYQLRKKLISLFLILCASILEVIFYASFNKMYEKDSIGSKRAFFYLNNNKFFFLLVLAFLYLVFYKKNNNIHNVLSLFLIFFSQIIIYIINYEENDKNYNLLLYGFFMNIIYASQNFIEKELNCEDNNKISTMFIIGKEGIFELILVIIFNIGVKCYYGQNPINSSLFGASITVKCIFMMLCVLLSEYMRIDTLNNYDPFYICFYEEIIYIFFSIYNYPSKELIYLFLHIIIILSFFVFIETIELNFCGLNHSTQRYLREREYGNLNEILQGIANISSLSTGSHSGSSDEYNNTNNDLIINDDNINLNLDINNSNEINLIIGKIDKENSGYLNDDDNKIKIEDDEKNINIGKILDEDEEENYDGEQKTVFSNHLID